jgi:outer membrane protein assembly factor BamB
MRHPIRILALLLLASVCGLGCGQISGLTSNAPGYSVDEAFTLVWDADLRLDQLSVVDVDEHGTHLLTGGADRRINIAIRDGATGSEAWREVNRGGISRFVDVQGVALDDVTGERHEYLLLGDDVMIFRQHIRGDSFFSRAAATGEERWRQEGYSWSPAKWAGVGRVLTNVVFESTRSIGATSAVATGAFVATIGSMVQNLTQLSPDGSLLLLLTGDGLAAFDRESGEQRWIVEGFRGGRIAHVLQLADGDLIAIAGHAEVLADLVNRHYVARIDPASGEVRWMEPYQRSNLMDTNAPAYVEAELRGDALIIQTAYMNVFDLATGERRVSAPTHLRDGGIPLVRVDDEAVYSVIDAIREVEFGVFFGEQSRIFRADLATGEEVWSTEASRTRVYDILRHGDLLVAAAEGSLVGGGARLIALDAATGEERWRTQPIEQLGALSGFTFTERVEAARLTGLLAHNGRLIVAGPLGIHAFDPATGEDLMHIDHASLDVGRVHRVFLENEALVAISDHGVSLFDADAGDVLFQTDRQRVAGYFMAGNRVFLQRGNRVSVVDLEERDVLGGFTINPPQRRLSGRLASGVFVTADGGSVFLLDRGGRVARFNI